MLQKTKNGGIMYVPDNQTKINYKLVILALILFVGFYIIASNDDFRSTHTTQNVQFQNNSISR